MKDEVQYWFFIRTPFGSGRVIVTEEIFNSKELGNSIGIRGKVVGMGCGKPFSARGEKSFITRSYDE